jgi:BirA family transcriptional regulator, biotin operon repressor / biotin---[acetyl-CoA-carboxylase] ligase
MLNTIVIGKVLLQFDELGSTNDYAAEIIAKSRPNEGTVVWADRQTAGRGQFGSSWESAPAENLTLSVIFYPVFLHPQQAFRLSQCAALAVLDTVQHYLPNAASAIKWPNDIYIGNQKTAGILIQNSLSTSQISHSIVGIGLNVNQTQFHSDAPNPTALALHYGGNLSRQAVAETLFEALSRRYTQLQHDFHSLAADYRQALFQLDAPARYMDRQGDIFTATLRRVLDDGRLALETENGFACFDLKEIRFVL